MDITKISDSVFKLKAKSGVAITDLSGPVIESLTGENIKSFTGPGEYEVAGISIIGVKIDDSNVFVYEVDDLRICHLGNISKKLPEAKISLLGDIDILLLPINDESIEITQQIENYYIIPYGYKSEDELAKF